MVDRPGSRSDMDLAAYQAQLLDILYQGGDGAAMADQIAGAAGHLNEPLGELDPVLVEVAAALTQTWGRLGGESGGRA